MILLVQLAQAFLIVLAIYILYKVLVWAGWFIKLCLVSFVNAVKDNWIAWTLVTVLFLIGYYNEIINFII